MSLINREEVILFVFEGEKTERTIFNCLGMNFFSGKKRAVVAAYGTVIYDLWRRLKNAEADEELDSFQIIREKVQSNPSTYNDKLEGLDVDNISEIYLFFDYDGHTDLASHEDLRDIISFFDDEHDQGRVYISYPMVEAIRHVSSRDNFKTLKVVSSPAYKKESLQGGRLDNFGQYKAGHWDCIISHNYLKAAFLIDGKDAYPVYSEAINYSQKRIFDHQVDSCLEGCDVYVYSAWPFFIVEFFGEKKYPASLVAVDNF